MHEQTHIADRTFSCNACSRTFKRPYYLKKHLRSCTGASTSSVDGLETIKRTPTKRKQPTTSNDVDSALDSDSDDNAVAPYILFESTQTIKRKADEVRFFHANSRQLHRTLQKLWAARPMFANDLIYKDVPGYSNTIIPADRYYSLGGEFPSIPNIVF